MAIRTTPELVAGIIEVDEEIALTPFISAAAALVDRVESYAIENELLLDGAGTDDPTREEKLQQIETWLAAHFYTVRDPRPTSESARGVGSNYQSAVTYSLFTSHYGQHAMLLDETGVLQQISAGANGTRRKQAKVSWVGKTAEEMTEE